jgi:hypothetical protein
MKLFLGFLVYLGLNVKMYATYLYSLAQIDKWQTDDRYIGDREKERERERKREEGKIVRKKAGDKKLTYIQTIICSY